MFQIIAPLPSNSAQENTHQQKTRIANNRTARGIAQSPSQNKNDH